MRDPAFDPSGLVDGPNEPVDEKLNLEQTKEFRSDRRNYSVYYAGHHILITEMQDGISMPLLYRTRLSPAAPSALKILRGYGTSEKKAIVQLLRYINIEELAEYEASQSEASIDEFMAQSLLPDRLERPDDGRG